MDIAWPSTFVVHSLLFLKVEQKRQEHTPMNRPRVSELFTMSFSFSVLATLLDHRMSFQDSISEDEANHILQVEYWQPHMLKNKSPPQRQCSSA